MKIKSNVKAGVAPPPPTFAGNPNHNETMLGQDRTVKTGVKAGVAPPPPTRC